MQPNATPADPAATSASPSPAPLTAALALGAATLVLVLSLAAVVVGADNAEVDRAADFSLRDADDRRVTLSELTADGAVLIVFDNAAELGVSPLDAAAALSRRSDVRIVVVRADTRPTTRLAALADAIQHDVILLADPDRGVAASYDVPDTPGLSAYAVLVDADGRIEARGDLASCLAAL